jgi:hypothetical protein
VPALIAFKDGEEKDRVVGCRDPRGLLERGETDFDRLRGFGSLCCLLNNGLDAFESTIPDNRPPVIHATTRIYFINFV